jgi:hypothetical protein
LQVDGERKVNTEHLGKLAVVSARKPTESADSFFDIYSTSTRGDGAPLQSTAIIIGLAIILLA